MTDTSRERCEAMAQWLREHVWEGEDPYHDHMREADEKQREAADLITALCERVTKVEGERDDAQEQAHGFCMWRESEMDKREKAEADLAEALEVVRRLCNTHRASLYPNEFTFATAFLTKHGAQING